MEQQKKEIQIRASDVDLKGVYSNVMQVVHTQEEFMIDFFNITGTTGILSARIILSPGHLKRMVQALAENMRKYENKFGPITPAASPIPEIGFKP